MRTAAEVKVRAGAQKSLSTTLAAPIGGLNARDSIANMPANDASILENWFPSTTSVDVRHGYTTWSTFTGVCQTILIYNGVSATSVFSCVKNGGVFSIFDSTSAGAVGVAKVGGGGATVEALGNTRFDYVNFGTSGGQFLIAVNGTNNPLQYDGTTWTVSGITGGTPANYQSICIYKRRAFLFDKNSFTVRYLPVDTIAGATASINLGSVFRLGGRIVAMATVTDDGGGLVDYIAFISSEGEVVAFTGEDPSAVATWTLSAHFQIGRPVIVGNRTWRKWGTDALVLCTDGVYPLRKAIAADRKIEGLSVSDKIRNLINTDIVVNGARYGWQLMLHSSGNKLLVNVPTNEDIASYQYVMNTQTGAWTKFTGWTAFCFEVAQDTLYMGGNGNMYKGDTGASDNTAMITCDGKQAFNYFGARGRAKSMNLVRPIMSVDGTYSIGVNVNVDYADIPPPNLRVVAGGSGDPWGGIWDAVWSGPAAPQLNWYGVGGVGHAVAVRVKTQTNSVNVSWSATDVVYEIGGVLA